MKERNYENLTFRMISYGDFAEFQRACLASDEELTAFLSFGKYMEHYIFADYWNLFRSILKERDTNAYGLFEGSTLVGFGTTSPANRSFGQQIVYWIRNGFHGKGYGVFLMHRLICRTIENGNSYAELIIDRENIPSIKVAESLGLTKIKEWERSESGQGKRNSGKAIQDIGTPPGITPLAFSNNAPDFGCKSKKRFSSIAFNFFRCSRLT